MKIKQREYHIRNLRYILRSAEENDSRNLSDLRLQIDGETENLDREQGEVYINEKGFKEIIKNDTESTNNLFLVAEVDGKIVGFSRCEGNTLKRTAHKVEFGVGVLCEYWGYRIGKNLLKESIIWADSNEIRKIVLNVLETNKKAIQLYQEFEFKIEGSLQKDKLLSDGSYYNSLLMARFNPKWGS